MFEAREYNGEFKDPVSILKNIYETLVEEQNEKQASAKGGAAARNNKSSVGKGQTTQISTTNSSDVVNVVSDVVEAGKINPIMIFKKIHMEKT